MSSTHNHYLKETLLKKKKGALVAPFITGFGNNYTLKAFTPPVKSYLNVGLPVMVPSL